MGLKNSLLGWKDRTKAAIKDFFYPPEEYPDPYDQTGRPPRRMKDETPVPQTPQVTEPVYDQSRDPFRQGYMPPRTAETAEPAKPAQTESENVVPFPASGEAAGAGKEREAAVRVINVRAVTDCYSAITQLRLGDIVILVMEQVSDPAEMRHYVDMLSGACYSLRATITKLSRHGAYLICPAQCRVYVDAATNQLNAPNRPVQRRAPAAPVMPGSAAANPYARAPQPGYAPLQANPPQPGYAPPYSQPHQGYAPPQPYPPQQGMQQPSYYSRGPLQEDSRPAAPRDFSEGYMPDMMGSDEAQ